MIRRAILGHNKFSTSDITIITDLVRHDADAGRVFVDKDMVWSTMGTGFEYALLGGRRDREGEEAGRRPAALATMATARLSEHLLPDRMAKFGVDDG